MKKLIVFLLALSGIISVSAQDLTLADQNKATVQHLIQIINQKDWADHAGFAFSKDEDFQSFKKVHAGFREVFPDYHYDLMFIAAEQDTVICIGTVTGTHSKTWDLFPVIPATGKKVSWIETTVYILKDGKMVDGMIINDRMSMMYQFGYSCMPEPFKP